MTEFSLIHCVIRGGYDNVSDDIVTANCSFLIPNTNINSNTIHEYFPYEGHYHFRIRTPGYKLGFNDIDYVWQDISEQDGLEFLNETTLEMQANIITLSESNGDDNDADLFEYLAKIKSGFEHIPRFVFISVITTIIYTSYLCTHT
jgi:hypothetical protein